MTDVSSDPMQGRLRYGMQGRMGTNSCRVSFANMWILARYHPPRPPLRDTLVSYLRDSVGLQDLLLHEYRGPSLDCTYDVGRFPGSVFQNRIPPSFAGFVDAELQAIIDRGCREVVGRLWPWGPAASPLSHGTVGRRD